MSQPKITLHYFPLRGRGEVARLVLHAAKREFVDNVVQFADWPALKPKAPFGSLPFLEYGDEVFGQSMAVTTFVAKEVGLFGSNNVEGLKIDQLLQLREDLVVEEVKAWKVKDAEAKAEVTERMNKEVYPKFLALFEKLIKENQAKTGSQYTVGSKLSLADIIIFEGTTTIRQQNPALLDSYPAVKAVASLVAGLDGVKQYLEKQPIRDL